MLRAQAREATGETDRALADYQQAARLDPKNVAALNAQAGIWRKKGELDKSIAAYDRAVAADQSLPATYKFRAEAYAAKGERKLAMADISRALKFTWTADLLRVRGELRLDDGDITGVVHDADAMLKLQADDPAALALRGAAFARGKDYARALDRSRQGDRRQRQGRPRFCRARPSLSRQERQHARACRFRPCHRAGQHQPGALSRAGDDGEKPGRHRQGHRRPQPGDQARPAAGGPYFDRASLRKSKGDIDQALADANEGLARQPDNTAGLLARAQIKQMKGDTAGTIADYDALLKRVSRKIRRPAASPRRGADGRRKLRQSGRRFRPHHRA